MQRSKYDGVGIFTCHYSLGGIMDFKEVINNMTTSDDKSIKLEQLRDCLTIVRSSSNITESDKEVLSKIEQLEKEARFQSWRDFTYELSELLSGELSDTLAQIRDKYFEPLEYDPSRE